MSNQIWLTSLVVGPIQTNCYILGNSSSHEAVLIDPGDEAERILQLLREKDVTPKAILLTHGHHDHILAVNALKQAYPDIEVLISETEKQLVENPYLNSSDGRFADYHYEPTGYLEGGDRLNFFGMDFYVIESPGHTAGSVCYYLETAHILFSGDTIFQGTHGRCDLPTGSTAQMKETLMQLLTTLPDDVQVLPGHGAPTTVGNEKETYGFDLLY